MSSSLNQYLNALFSLQVSNSILPRLTKLSITLSSRTECSDSHKDLNYTREAPIMNQLCRSRPDSIFFPYWELGHVKSRQSNGERKIFKSFTEMLELSNSFNFLIPDNFFLYRQTIAFHGELNKSFRENWELEWRRRLVWHSVEWIYLSGSREKLRKSSTSSTRNLILSADILVDA